MNKIIDSLTYNEHDASLIFGGNRYILVRADTLILFQKMVEHEHGQLTSQLMFKAAFEIGTQIGEAYMREFQLPAKDMILSMIGSASELGWAKLQLNETDNFPAEVILEARNSTFASAYGKSKIPVCHFVTGIFSGALSQMIAPVKKSIETECIAMGSDKCVFNFMFGPV